MWPTYVRRAAWLSNCKSSHCFHAKSINLASCLVLSECMLPYYTLQSEAPYYFIIFVRESLSVSLLLIVAALDSLPNCWKTHSKKRRELQEKNIRADKMARGRGNNCRTDWKLLGMRKNEEIDRQIRPDNHIVNFLHFFVCNLL